MQILGLILILIPIAIMFGLTVRNEGWKTASIVWGTSIAMTACFMLGVLLLFPAAP